MTCGSGGLELLLLRRAKSRIHGQCEIWESSMVGREETNAFSSKQGAKHGCRYTIKGRWKEDGAERVWREDLTVGSVKFPNSANVKYSLSILGLVYK